MPLDLAALRRRPDVEAPDLVAHDAADALILDEAERTGGLGGPVVVIGDGFGALTLGALDRGAAEVRVHQDPITSERALDANARVVGITGFRHLALEPELVEGAELVLVRLPRGLDALDEIAALVATHAAPGVRLVAGGRIKHMSRGQNAVLERHFGSVRASLGVRKARVLHATGPQPSDARWPRTARLDDVGLEVVAHGAAFAGASLDHGTRLLLERIDGMPVVDVALDLGCGTGLLAAGYAREHPGPRVLARDRSAAAVQSASATTAANGVVVDVAREDGAADVPDASVGLVLLNPPFHAGDAVHTGIARHLFAEAARVLWPGGELWCVWNSPLAYRSQLDRIVGPTRQVHRTPTFTVTVSRRG